MNSLPPNSPPNPRARNVLGWPLIVLLLALLQTLLAGYRLGVGNQSIQIPFLQHEMDHRLFASDPMVQQTLHDYPTWFFRILAAILPHTHLDISYFLLQLLTSAAVFAALLLLARSMFGNWRGGILACLLLLAGHHHALAGDDLYSAGFTHTWAVLPLAIAALALIYRGWLFPAFLLAGLIFNLHALTGGYLAVMFAFYALGEYRTLGWKKILLLALLLMLAASPTLYPLAQQHGQFDAQWIRLTRLRSATHSFPSEWWKPDSPDIPRFALLVALGAIALSFPGLKRANRITILLAAGVGFMMLIGFIFSELLPIPLILRAQLFRASRLLLVLAFCQIGHAIYQAWTLPKTNLSWDRRSINWMEAAVASLAFITLAVPPLLPFLPIIFLAMLLAALLNGRLSLPQSILCAIVAWICLIAHQQLGFPLSGDWHAPPANAALPNPASNPILILSTIVLLLLFTGFLAWSARRSMPKWAIYSASIAAVAAACLISARLFLNTHAAQAADPWIDAQLWARQHTSADDLFLTPPLPGGFRIHSQRPIVGEWRDGTQAYFSPHFGALWNDLMHALQPDAVYDAAGSRLLDRGKSIAALDVPALLKICRQYHADYLVLPRNGISPPGIPFRLAYDNTGFSIYQVMDPAARQTVSTQPLAIAHPATTHSATTTAPSQPNIIAHAPSTHPTSQLLVAVVPTPPSTKPATIPASAPAQTPIQIAQDQFMRDTVLPNIEKYRKSDARVQLLDDKGIPLMDAQYDIQQTSQTFNFGCSLAFFTTPAPEPGAANDFLPTPATEAEKKFLPEIFNFSLIAFSGKWMYTEPREGEKHYDDLDRYVDWCTQNHIGMEYHFVSGYAPTWLTRKPLDQQNALFLQHAHDLVERYGSRIQYWQVVNERHLIDAAAPVFAEMRRLSPDIKLGISDCAQFYSSHDKRQRENPLLRGLQDVKTLQSKGAKVDFFAFHGHRPFGVWPEASEMYEALDGFAQQGVKIHISEFSCPLGHEILGRLKHGAWTPELQAEYYRYFYTVCFSHPAVEMINLWGMGPVTWQAGAGLLDAQANPKPDFFALEHLIRDEWRTRLSGQVPLDGTIHFRGFHGDYKISVKTADGRSHLTGTFTVSPAANADINLKIDPRSGLLIQNSNAAHN